MRRSSLLMISALILICGWVAIVTLVIQPSMLIGGILSVAGGVVIGGIIAYILVKPLIRKIRHPH